MSTAKITLTYELGDAERDFALPIGKLEELHELTGVGPLRLYEQLAPIFSGLITDPTMLQQMWASNPHSGNYKPTAIRDIIRLSLIGGGATPLESSILVKRYVDTEPLLTYATLAYAILGKALVPDVSGEEVADDVGKMEAPPT